jgi:hypothetical protein
MWLETVTSVMPVHKGGEKTLNDHFHPAVSSIHTWSKIKYATKSHGSSRAVKSPDESQPVQGMDLTPEQWLR